jgi:DNA polymerase III epsilon subunit-like protein
MRYVFIDLETTGLEPKENGIFELSYIIYDTEEKKDLVCKTLKMKLFPGQKFSNDVHLLFKKTSQQLRESVMSNPEPERAYSEFISDLSKYQPKGDKYFIVGYNYLGFDDKFLREFFKLNNAGNLFQKLFWWPPIDVSVLAMEMFKEHRAKFENFKQITVAKFMKIQTPVVESHNSMEDVLITKQMYLKLIGEEN